MGTLEPTLITNRVAQRNGIGSKKAKTVNGAIYGKTHSKEN